MHLLRVDAANYLDRVMQPMEIAMDAIEMGAHDSNMRARPLYEKWGFQTVKRLGGLGFLIMQKPLSEREETRGRAF